MKNVSIKTEIPLPFTKLSKTTIDKTAHDYAIKVTDAIAEIEECLAPHNANHLTDEQRGAVHIAALRKAAGYLLDAAEEAEMDYGIKLTK